MLYRVLQDWGDGSIYWIGFGKFDTEFTIVASAHSKQRAEQIARLLNWDENQ